MREEAAERARVGRQGAEEHADGEEGRGDRHA